VHLILDIFQGLGVAAAAGIRPFLPALAVGALAAGDIQIDFHHTDYAFLQSWEFLLGMAVGTAALAALGRGGAGWAGGRRLPGLAVVCGLASGAVLFAGALAQDHHRSWPGLIAGAACAALAALATGPLLGRVSARLGGRAGALLAYAEGAALAVAVLAVLLPPLGVVAVGMLGWLLVAGRRRAGEKYAGLRILR
jgi:hypothetical protein